jgi:hypothetical protein
MKGNDTYVTTLTLRPPRQQAQPLKPNNSQREGMEILAPAEGLIDKAIRLATKATNIASSEAEVPGYMTDQASINKALEEIGDAIQVIQAHPALTKFGDVKVIEEGENIYAFVCSSADRHILYPPSLKITEKGSPISQLLQKLTDLRNNVLALRSKRQLTPEEQAKISAISL